MPKMRQAPKRNNKRNKGQVVHMFLNFFERFTLKKAFLSASFLVLSFALASSCSRKTNNSKTPAKDDKTDNSTKKTPEDTAPARDPASDDDAGADEVVKPDTLSFDLTSGSFLFSDELVKLKSDADSKIVTLVFKGGFEEGAADGDDAGKVVTTGTIYQGLPCNDKHGSNITDAQYHGRGTAVLTAEEQEFPKAETGPGVKECYKQIPLPDDTPTAVGSATAAVLTTATARPTEAANNVSDSTIVAVDLPVANEAKNDDARLGSCTAKLKTDEFLELKAKISVQKGKLQIQFWDEKSGAVDASAINATGFAKIKKAVGLKTYSKSEVMQIPGANLAYTPVKNRGNESSPIERSDIDDGDCFKYLYALQQGVKENYLEVAGNDDADKFLPPDEDVPSGATISAHKTLKSLKQVYDATTQAERTRLKLRSTEKPSDKYLANPQIVVKYSGKTFPIGTKALDQLLKKIDPTINFAGISKRRHLVDTMGELAEFLELEAAE